MGLIIRYMDGEKSGQSLTFGDEVTLVVLGRDAETCQVVFPTDEKKVGRQHCALKRVLGRTRLVLDTEHHVLVGGKSAHDEQELEPTTVLQLGPGGPRVEVSVQAREGLTKTVFQGGRRPQMGEMVQEATRTARKTWKVAATSAVLTLLVGGGGWWLIQQTTLEGERTAKKVESLAERQAGVLDDVRKKVSGVEEQLSRAEPGMKEALRRAAKSVYLCVLVSPDGGQEPEATAWVVKPGVLATNAHVAELFVNMAEGQRFLVRSSDSPARSHTVQKVEIHPGYAEFSRIWQEYAPHLKAGGARYAQLRSVPACDVALLYVDDAEKLAPPLTLASEEKLKKLSSPEAVGFVGYPSENMAVGGVNVTEPEPTVQVGHVTAVTDFFLGKNITGDGQLVQHALPATGGASGSPILDAQGDVIAILNAGNISVSDKGRLPLAVGVNFAQRSDLVRELLEGKAEEAQKARSAQWQEGIKQFASFQEVFADAIKQDLEKLKKQWLEANSLTKVVSDVEHVVTLQPPDAMGRHIGRVALTDLPAGPYVFIAMPDKPRDVDLYMFRGGQGDQIGMDEEPSLFAVVGITLRDVLSLDATAVGPEVGLKVTLHVIRGE